MIDANTDKQEPSVGTGICLHCFSIAGLLNAFFVRKTATFFWRDLIKNLLPAGSNGVIVVISCACSPDFTYQIDGPNTTYLGRGDLHDPNFDGMGIESNFSRLKDYYIKKR
jgi:hypothetical protein